MARRPGASGSDALGTARPVTGEGALGKERARLSDVCEEERERERVRGTSPATRCLHGRQWPDGGDQTATVRARGEVRARQKG
jgi:hypothetical protein